MPLKQCVSVCVCARPAPPLARNSPALHRVEDRFRFIYRLTVPHQKVQTLRPIIQVHLDLAAPSQRVSPE